jgi:hypothetical protein
MARSHSSGRYTTTSPTTAASSNAAVASKTTTDPAALLARGYTARYLGAVLQKRITALTDEEMERDLRHITAYQEAATRYHQLTYAANNRLQITPDGEIAVQDGYASQHGHAYGGSASSNAAALSSYTVLPVRIDPEEEKRAVVQARRIQRAEAVREELETHYVALRAHYVVTTQELQQLQSDFERTVDFLQTTVASTAATVGYQRARLEMTRNVRAALQVRTAALQQRADPDSCVTDPTQYASGAEQCPMLAAWLAVEEDCKRHFAAPPAKSKKTKLGTNSTASATATTLPWSCTTQPLMPPGVPILLSALSTDPCKSLATGVGPMFGSSHPRNMTWVGLHLPNEVEDMSGPAGGISGADQEDGPDKPTAGGNDDDDPNDLLTAEMTAVDRLRNEVAYLEHELVAERQANQALLVTTASARTQQDEWVAMISLVRQETEAVLHRHNVLLESDEVRDAAVAWPAESSTAAAAAALPDSESKVEHAGTVAVGPSARVASKESLEDEEGDHANEADDEGMAEEGEEGDDWDSSHPATAAAALPSKRSAATATGPTEESEESSPGGSRKRRKV